MAAVTAESKKRQQVVAAEIAKLTRQIESVEKNAARKSLTALQRWGKLDPQQQREHLSEVIARIIVWPGRLEVYTTLNPESPTVVPLKGSRVAPQWWHAKGLRIRATVDMRAQIAEQVEERE